MSSGVRVLALSLGLVVCPVSVAAAGSEEDYQRGYDAYLQGDVIAAMEYLEKPANAGYAPAQVLLAFILDKAEENERALELYRSAADQGDPEGQMGLGAMYAAGDGVERDAEQARAWITRAAEQGHGPATVVLAEAYLGGGLGLEPSDEQAIQWLERGAQAGHEPARRKLDEIRAKAVPSEDPAD